MTLDWSLMVKEAAVLALLYIAVIAGLRFYAHNKELEIYTDMEDENNE